ncbi:hypothetical protein AMTR_s00117p00122540 [Amborella trichopoda]|uniref:Uncharacterized protein n=1 Tax=Amborella trichopoda TaxID=13333 RepID=W1NSX8_AMBTC|nr:hypothetical protein AMTR_s00117p00122540 [Amborella trichopoda]
MRNKLEQKRLNDFVFVQYNQKQEERYQERNVREALDVGNVDNPNERLVDARDYEVFPRENFTWGQVCEASRTPLGLLRTIRSKFHTQRKGKRLLRVREKEEADSNDTRDEGEYVEEKSDFDDDGMASSSKSIRGDDETQMSF